MVAAAGDSVWYGTSLLGTYAAGMGAPFLIAALAVKPFMKLMGRMRKHMRTVELTIGTLLVVTGVAIFTGLMADAAFWLLEVFPFFAEFG